MCVGVCPTTLLGQEVAAVVVVREGGIARRRRGAGVGRRRAGLATRSPPTSTFKDELPYNATGKVLKNEVEDDLVAQLGAEKS